MIIKNCLILGIFLALATTANAWHVVFKCTDSANRSYYRAFFRDATVLSDVYIDTDITEFSNESLTTWKKDKKFPCGNNNVQTLISGNSGGYIAKRKFHLEDENINAVVYQFGETQTEATDSLNAAIAKRANFQKVTFFDEIDYIRTKYNPIVKPTPEAVSEYIRNIPTEVIIKRIKNSIAKNDAQNKIADEMEKIIQEGNWPELLSLKFSLKLQKNEMSSALMRAYIYEMELRVVKAEADLKKQNELEKNDELKNVIETSYMAVNKINLGKWNFFKGLTEEEALLMISKTGQKEKFESQSGLTAINFFYHQFYATVYVMGRYNQMTHQDFIGFAEEIDKMR